MLRTGGFHHLVLPVTDLERSERFYEATLGLTPLGRDAWPEEQPNAPLSTDDGQYVVLVQVPEVGPEGPGVHTNFMLSLEDYHDVFDRLRKLGGLLVDHRSDNRSVGEISTYFQDPDGHRLQITAITEEASQVPAAGQGKIVAGHIADFPVGSVTWNDEGKFYLVRLPEGVLAISEVCTHMQCSVVYQPEHYRFYCPCHENKFTWKGDHLGHMPNIPPLHTYAIEIVDGRVVVDTDTSIGRRPRDAAPFVPLPDGAH